jgi:hypothetical protein
MNDFTRRRTVSDQMVTERWHSTQSSLLGETNVERNEGNAGREESSDTAIEATTVIAQSVNIRRSLYQDIARYNIKFKRK